jgi:hypothetical protein
MTGADDASRATSHVQLAGGLAPSLTVRRGEEAAVMRADFVEIRVAHADRVRELGQLRLAPFVRPAAGPVNPRGRAPPARRR